jgi:hypothetical protein
MREPRAAPTPTRPARNRYATGLAFVFAIVWLVLLRGVSRPLAYYVTLMTQLGLAGAWLWVSPIMWSGLH